VKSIKKSTKRRKKYSVNNKKPIPLGIGFLLTSFCDRAIVAALLYVLCY
jgi:hypothetical protein